MDAKIRANFFITRLQNWFYCIRCSIFRTLEVILRLLEVWLLRFGRKRLFACFEIVFSTFTVLFLAHRRLFWVYWRYVCPDTGENVYSLALKSGLRHWPFYFKPLDVIVRLLHVHLQDTGENVFSLAFKIVFTAIDIVFLEHWCFFSVYCW